jgi:hypothetical protein
MDLFTYDPEREPLSYSIILKSVENDWDHGNHNVYCYEHYIGNYCNDKDLTPDQLHFIRKAQYHNTSCDGYILICNNMDINGTLYNNESNSSHARSFNNVEDLITAINRTTPSQYSKTIAELEQQINDLQKQKRNLENDLVRQRNKLDTRIGQIDEKLIFYPSVKVVHLERIRKD